MNEVDVQDLITKFLKSFIEQHREDSIDVEGIILFGSALSDKYFYKHSDIDVYVVIKNNKKRYRGIRIIDGIEIDYFVNPIEQLEKDFKMASTSDKKTVLFMLADGKIIEDTNDNLLRLQKSAKDLLNKEKKVEMNDFQILNAKYFINDYIKDIKDSSDNDDIFTWQRNITLLLNYLIDTFSMYNNILVTKPKYQKDDLMSVDNKFVQMYEGIANSQSYNDTEIKIEELAKYVIDNMGGDLQDEWELKSDL